MNLYYNSSCKTEHLFDNVRILKGVPMSDYEFITEIKAVLCDDNNYPKITVEQLKEITSSFLQQSSNTQ